MPLLTPPGYLQGGTYSARLDRVYNTTNRAFADGGETLSARQGFYNGRAPEFSNSGGWTVAVGPCAGIILNDFVSPGGGDYDFAADGATLFTTAASSPTQNRVDILGFQVKDNFYDGSGQNSIVPMVLQGTYSSGTAVDPALPAAFIPAVRARVDAGSSTPVLSSLVQYTTSDGGTLLVETLAQRGTVVARRGQRIYRLDAGFEETWDGVAWRVPSGALVQNLSDVTNPRVSQTAVLSGDGLTYRWNGSAWKVTSGALPRFSAYQTVVQSVPPGTWTPLTFTAEMMDTANGHSTTTNTSRYVCPFDGVLDVTGKFQLADGAVGSTIGVGVWRNGTSVLGGSAFFGTASIPASASLTAPLFEVQAGNYIEVVGYHLLSGNRNTAVASDVTSTFSLKYVERT